MNVPLPNDLRVILWPYRFEAIDSDRDAQAVIVQVINYGTLTHWRWLARRYGAERICSELASIAPSTMRKEALGLAKLIFGYTDISHAPRGAHQ